jgi:hypothetical protein
LLALKDGANFTITQNDMRIDSVGVIEIFLKYDLYATGRIIQIDRDNTLFLDGIKKFDGLIHIKSLWDNHDTCLVTDPWSSNTTFTSNL